MLTSNRKIWYRPLELCLSLRYCYYSHVNRVHFRALFTRHSTQFRLPFSLIDEQILGAKVYSELIGSYIIKCCDNLGLPQKGHVQHDWVVKYHRPETLYD